MAQATDGTRRQRPLSPHLTIWKWGPHMAVSIFHRATGMILALGAVPMLVWFLVATAAGGESFETFRSLVVSGEDVPPFLHIAFLVVLVGVSWAWFQHMLSGVRHLLLDVGAGYELRGNRTWSRMVFVGAAVLTLGLWAYVFLGRGA